MSGDAIVICLLLFGLFAIGVIALLEAINDKLGNILLTQAHILQELLGQGEDIEGRRGSGQ